MGPAGSDRDASALRIVAFNVEPAAYHLVAGWIAQRGHELALLVTTPGPPPRTYHGYREIVAEAAPGQDVLVTTRLKRAAAPIAAVAPDLIVSYTFPYRIPAALREIPRLGAVNLHPTPLPRYRGPNPARMIYAGEPTIGATLHRTEEGFDTGAILSRQECPLPPDPTVENLHAAWHRLLMAALDEGVRRAATGDPGDPQDAALACYAASFTPEERWLDWSWTRETLQRRASALNLLEPRAVAWVDGRAFTVLSVRPLQGVAPSAPAGELLGRDGDVCWIAAGDGVVEVRVGAASIEAEPVADPGIVASRGAAAAVA